jgi:Protein of unknown function (DUF2848)
MPMLEFEVGGTPRLVDIDTLIIAGWTGRDAAAVEHHIAELEALGVKRPRSIPCFYRVGANLLTTASEIDVVGSDSSGEVEFVLISLTDGLHVGVGSDQTDRKVESYGVTVAKQMCPKPVSRTLWKMAELEGRWDELTLRSWVTRGGRRELYQEGRVTKMREPRDLMSRYLGHAGPLPVGTAMFCGTLAAIGPVSGGDSFEIELEDPHASRSLRHAYATRRLEIAD